MNILLTGGAGFIGTNLTKKLAENPINKITIIAKEERHFEQVKKLAYPNIFFRVSPYDINTDFEEIVRGQEIIYHLASTNIPGTSNHKIPEEIQSNVIVTIKLLDACVKEKVKKVIFLSSGGTVYGKKGTYPIEEDMVTYPISSYGIQKVTIEKVLYLYRYQFELDYRVIRLANPYGPYQRPDGQLGVVTTFVYRALTDGKLEVYGDGSIVRDFIYIDDAIEGILKIADGESEFRVFNLGSGKGTSVNEVIDAIRDVVNNNLTVNFVEFRAADVPVNYLSIRRFEKAYGKLNLTSLKDGIKKTAEFFQRQNANEAGDTKFNLKCK